MLSSSAKRRLEVALGSGASADELEALLWGLGAPNVYFVRGTNGQDQWDGKSYTNAFLTMDKALDTVDDHDAIIQYETVREQLTAPLGVYGVRIIGGAGGRTRHDDGGARWTYPSSGSTNAALMTIRQQGWEFHNILFVPKDGYSAIRAHRAESATYPDSSHFIVRGCKFIGPGGIGTPQGRGIGDFGGNHHYLVEGCEFNDLEYAIGVFGEAGDPGIAAPLRNTIQDNDFSGNKNDIYFNASRCIIRRNLFRTVYHATDHPNTVNLAPTSDIATGNSVYDNFFADTSGNVTVAKGYKPSTGDVWCNHVAGTAAYIVAVPT